jgi:AraC-like DNA-binding protein
MQKKCYTFNGETLSVAEWADRCGISRQAFCLRLEKHSFKDALEPVPAPVGRMLTHNGETMNLRGWAKKLGMNYATLCSKLKNNSLGDIISGNVKRKYKKITYNGETLTTEEWSKKLGISRKDVYYRFSYQYQKVQQRRCKRITYNGETLTISEWASKLGISDSRLRYNLKVHGIEDALSTTYRNYAKKLLTCNGETLTLIE